jgi:RNA polymerase sigma-70 factor, ECF subfamily
VSAAPVSTTAGIESAEAANDLFERYHDRIYAFCMSRTRNPTDAEDATQTAFMHALNGLRRGVVPQFELTWLLRIAENVCHSMHRRAYRRYERDELPADVISGREDTALVTERFNALRLAVESLPDQQRRAILLREWRGLSYDDIADELGVSHAAVETTLFRARRTLVKQLGSLAAFPFPAIGRFAHWIAGPTSVKAAAVAVVTIGTATAVVASAPADVARPFPLGATKKASPGVESRSVPARPSTKAAGVERVGATGAPGSIPAAPGVGGAAGEASPPESPIEPRAEPTVTLAPAAGGVDLPEAVAVPAAPPAPALLRLPIVLPLPPVPVDPTEVLAPLVQLTTDVEEALPVELPPVVTGLPILP